MERTNDLYPVLHQARKLWKVNSQASYDYYDDLLRKYPNNLLILREYGKALFMGNDDLNKALDLLKYALDKEPGTLLSWLYLGLIYTFGYGKGYSEAIKVYSSIIKAFPGQTMACVEAYLRIGACFQAPGVELSSNEAIEAFRQATKLAPQCPEAYQCLAQGLYDIGDSQGALEALEYAIQLREQQGSLTKSLLGKLSDLKAQKPWISGSYPIPSIAFHWPDEVIE